MTTLSDPVALALIAALSSLLASVTALITWVVVRSMRADIRTLEKNTNSIKDELVKVTGEAKKAEGIKEGLAVGRSEGAAEEKAKSAG